MREDDARLIALELLQERGLLLCWRVESVTRRQKLYGKGQIQYEWIVIFKLDEGDDVCSDAVTIVRIDDITGQASFAESW